MAAASADILIVGATSFIGRAVLPVLAAGGRHIVATCNRSAPAAVSGNVTFVHADLADPDGLGLLPGRVGTIVHLAAAASDLPGARQIAVTNVTGLEHLLRYAERSGAERFIFTSSISVHGDLSSTVIDESTEVHNPGAYGISKRLGEMMLADIADRIPSASLRLPAVLGKGARRHWPARVLSAARAGGPVRFYNPQADFNAVIDLRSLCAFIARLCAGNWSGAQAFPVCCSGKASVEEAVRILLEGAGLASGIDIIPGDLHSYVIDPRAALALGLEAMPVRQALADYAAAERQAEASGA